MLTVSGKEYPKCPPNGAKTENAGSGGFIGMARDSKATGSKQNKKPNKPKDCSFDNLNPARIYLIQLCQGSLERLSSTPNSSDLTAALKAFISILKDSSVPSSELPNLSEILRQVRSKLLWLIIFGALSLSLFGITLRIYEQHLITRSNVATFRKIRWRKPTSLLWPNAAPQNLPFHDQSLTCNPPSCLALINSTLTPSDSWG